MKAGVAISLAGHAALLIWSVWSFAVKPLEAKSVESVPVDVISEKDFSQITAGQKNAKQAETPKPVVEKVAEKNKVEDLAPKPTEKKEVVATQEATPPPPQPKQEAKPDPKPEKKEPDQIAEALKKEKAKPQPKQAEKPPIPVPPNFDPMKIKALLDKQAPKRVAAAGDTLNSTPSVGLSTANARTLSQSELDALRARLAKLWSPPVGAKNPEELVVRFRIQLGRDGTLMAPPMVLPPGGNGPLYVASRDSAARAILRGQPYDMLRQETYDTWKDVEITFDPRQMFGG